MSTRHIVMTTWGSFGDLHPYIAVALELKARGHRVTLLAPELYQKKVEELDLNCRALRPVPPDPEKEPDVFMRLMDTQRGTQRLFSELIMPHLSESFDDVWQATEDADLLVTHPIVFAGPIVAELRKLRWVSVALAPISFFSMCDPSVPPITPEGAPLLRFSFFRHLLRFASEKMTARWLSPVQELRCEVGLKAGANPIFEGQHSPYRVLALFSQVMGKPQPDWPANTIQTGFCFYDQRGNFSYFRQQLLSPKGDDSRNQLSPELEEFLQAGPPPIVFTLGTSAVLTAGDFYHQAAVAAQQLNQRAVLLCGEAKNIPTNLPPNIAAFDYAPHSQIFPRAAAVVHQGGAGTTAQVLRAGVPMLVVPFSHDQPDNAARMQRLGVARTLSRKKYSAHNCAAELQKLLSHECYKQRAKEVAEMVRNEGGAKQAAHVIEEELLKIKQ